MPVRLRSSKSKSTEYETHYIVVDFLSTLVQFCCHFFFGAFFSHCFFGGGLVAQRPQRVEIPS